jgi:hypothetical protein
MADVMRAHRDLAFNRSERALRIYQAAVRELASQIDAEAPAD